MTKSIPRQNRRDTIITVATRLFQQKGYDRTTVRDLADAVGMRSGSLFYHFDTKEDILIAVIEDGIDRALALLDQHLVGAKSASDKLYAILISHLEILHKGDPNAILLLGTEWNLLSEAGKQRLIGKQDSYEARLNHLLDEVAAAGVIQTQEIGVFRLFILGALNWTPQWYKLDKRLSLEELAEHFLTFIIKTNSYEPYQNEHQPEEQRI